MTIRDWIFGEPEKPSLPIPPGAMSVHELPTSLVEPPPEGDDLQAEEDESASIWAQALCGRGPIKSPRVRTADELEAKRLKGQGSKTLQQIYGEKKLKPPTNIPKAPVDWLSMIGTPRD
jgi:hypothetical protein